MPFSIKCRACGTRFSVPGDLFDRPSSGMTATVYCSDCGAKTEVNVTDSLLPPVAEGEALPSHPPSHQAAGNDAKGSGAKPGPSSAPAAERRNSGPDGLPPLRSPIVPREMRPTIPGQPAVGARNRNRGANDPEPNRAASRPAPGDRGSARAASRPLSSPPGSRPAAPHPAPGDPDSRPAIPPPAPPESRLNRATPRPMAVPHTGGGTPDLPPPPPYKKRTSDRPPKDGAPVPRPSPATGAKGQSPTPAQLPPPLPPVAPQPELDEDKNESAAKLPPPLPPVAPRAELTAAPTTKRQLHERPGHRAGDTDRPTVPVYKGDAPPTLPSDAGSTGALPEVAVAADPALESEDDAPMAAIDGGGIGLEVAEGLASLVQESAAARMASRLGPDALLADSPPDQPLQPLRDSLGRLSDDPLSLRPSPTDEPVEVTRPERTRLRGRWIALVRRLGWCAQGRLSCSGPAARSGRRRGVLPPVSRRRSR